MLPQEIQSIIMKARYSSMLTDLEEKKREKEEELSKILQEVVIDNFEPCYNCGNNDADTFEDAIYFDFIKDNEFVGHITTYCSCDNDQCQCWYIDRDGEVVWSD